MKFLFKRLLCLILIGIMLLDGSSLITAKASTDNVIQNAIPISENGSYSGTAPENGEVFYRLDLQTSGKVTFEINLFQDSTATVELYNNEYEFVRYNGVYYDGNRDCAHAKLAYCLHEGTYYIKISNLYDAVSYSFSLDYQETKESFPESQSNPNDILAQAKTVSLEKTYYGMIGDGDEQDFYIFTVPFAGNVIFTHYNYIDSGWGGYEILDSDGNSVQSFRGYYDSNKGYAYDKDTYWLKKGTYYLKTYGDNGAYKFSIKVKPDVGAVDYGTRSKTKATLKLKKSEGVTGYVVQYSTSEKFSKKSTKTKTVKGTTVKLSGLNKNKVYYVRVRCYKKWNGKTYYGAYGNRYVLWP